MVERELVPADSAEVTLLAGMSVAVLDDRDGTAVRTVKLVHGLFNPHRAQESTTTRVLDTPTLKSVGFLSNVCARNRYVNTQRVCPTQNV